ncbi:MAG TPA: hypothetical protein VHC63_03715 [Acidimicrobiales bacterium]|nr:hypothetical protein [Acidimicrobiales bacterium]
MINGQFIRQASAYRSAAGSSKTTVRHQSRTRKLVRKVFPQR